MRQLYELKNLWSFRNPTETGKIREEKVYNTPIFPNQICKVKMHTDSFSLLSFSITNYDIFTSLRLDVCQVVSKTFLFSMHPDVTE